MNRRGILVIALLLMGVITISSVVIAGDDSVQLGQENIVVDAPINISPVEDVPAPTETPMPAEIVPVPDAQEVDKDLFDDSARFGSNFEKEITIKTLDGSRHEFSIELALSPREQEKGLMFRQSMPAMHGMLFVFGSDMQRSFWMKNTLIPLDILFLERDGRIQHIHSMAKPQDLSMITSGRPSYAVLELNGGATSKLGISAGDYVYNTAFRNNNLQ